MAIATKQRSFPSLGNLTTLKICTAYGTQTKVTQPEIVASLLIDTQERATMEKEKKITRRRMKIIKKIRDLKKSKGRSPRF
jgi:CO dehydrogenase/acetyl-CoA synthase alpha subunit